MKVTNVKIIKIKNSKNNVKGLANIVLDNSIAINSIRIIETKEKRFLAMPSIKTSSGKFKDTVHPVNEEVREDIQAIVFTAFDEMEQTE